MVSLFMSSTRMEETVSVTINNDGVPIIIMILHIKWINISSKT